MNESRCNKILVGATIVLAVAACAAAILSYWSAKGYGEKIETAILEMKGISNNMTKYFEFSARPILSIEMDDWKISHQKYKWKYLVPIYLKNYGALPANKVKVRIK